MDNILQINNEDKIKYIAKIGHMWVKDVCLYSGELTLTYSKNSAMFLDDEDAEWVKLKTGAKIIKSAVSITELGIA